MKTVEYEVEGPIALLFSTTNPTIHFENATRCFTLTLDESSEQTMKVHYAQSLNRTMEGRMRAGAARGVKQLHRNIQRLLKTVVVLNPYAPRLTFPTNRLESRREFEKYLSLIEAVAFLRQYQKEVKKMADNGGELAYIEVEPKDIEEANALITEILGTSADEISGPSRELIKKIREMAEARAKEMEIDITAYRFNRRDIREYTGWSDNQIKAHIGQLEELQYLLVKQGERGKLYRYELAGNEENEGKKRFFGLADPDKLEKLGLVGYKLGDHGGASSVGERPSSWEVGHF